MGEVKQINIKNRTYYFYNDQIHLKYFDVRLLKVDKKDYKEIDIYCIGYLIVKKSAHCNNINSVNPLYLLVTHASWLIEEKNGNKCLIFDGFVNENKAPIKKCADVGMELKTKSKQ